MSQPPPATGSDCTRIDQPEPGIKSASEAASITAKLTEHPSRDWLDYALACFIESADGPCVGIEWALDNPDKFAAIFGSDPIRLYEFLMSTSGHRDFEKLFDDPRAIQFFGAFGIPVLQMF